MSRFVHRRFEGRARALVVITAGLVLALSACGKDQASSTTTTGTPAAVSISEVPSSSQQSSAVPAADTGPTSGSPTPTSASSPEPPRSSESSGSSEPTGSSESAGTSGSSGASATGQAPVPAEAPIANAVTIDTPGMRYDVSGALRPGTAAITLTNTDDVAHMMAVARLKKGVTLKQVVAALAKGEAEVPPLLADPPDTAYGTPSLVGAGQSTTVTAMDLPAGHYALICFLTGNDGMSHWQMGMVDELTVSGDKATEKPSSDGTITIDDKGVALPEGFTGSGTFEVVNKGKRPHGFSLARLDAGTSLAAFAGHVGMAENSGQAVDGGGGVLAGGVDILAPGQSAFLTLALPPGHYGFLSPEDMTGPELPAQHGEFDVK